MAFSSYYRPNQKTAYTHVGGNTDLDTNRDYVKNQADLLQSQNQKNIGTIPQHINRTYHSDIIQSARYGISLPEPEHGSNVPPDKFHQYDPYYDFLHSKGLLKENFKTRINATYMNIDSSSRSLIPIMKTINDTKLGTNPLMYGTESVDVGVSTSTQNLLVIYYPEHTLNVNDRITLAGIEKTVVQIRTIYVINNTTYTAVVFTPGSTSVAIICNYDSGITISPMSFDPNFRISTSGLTYSTLKAYDTSNMTATISGFDVSPDGAPYLGNIPINFLNSTHTMYLTNPDFIIQNGAQVFTPDTIINVPSNGMVSKITGFYIKLNAPFVGDIPLRSSTLSLTFNHVGGYPINKINAEFPIDENRLIGYHQVRSITANTITVAIDKKVYYFNTSIGASATAQSSFGGFNIYIAQITNLINGYNTPGNYRIELSKTIQNVIMAKLVSTAFPNTSKIFRNNTGDSNNKIYWQNQDDGDFVYSISIIPGNYSPRTLETAIEKQINQVPKKYLQLPNQGTKYTNFNFMKVIINESTDVVTFESFKVANLKKPIQNIFPEILSSGDANPPYTLTISQVGHGLIISDTVSFTGMIPTFGIPENILNTDHIVTSVPTSDTYTIIIDNFNLSDIRNNTNGGNAVVVYVHSIFKLLFNYPDTMGIQLGFRNVGESSSVTKFSTAITNCDEYQDEIITIGDDGLKTVLDESGNQIVLRNNALKMNGDDYILMTIREFSAIVNISDVKSLISCFAKINLTNSPGNIVYDSFVASPAVLYEPIDLYELNISLFSPSGVYFDFNGVNHSFVLEITSIDYVPQETGIVSTHTMF